MTRRFPQESPQNAIFAICLFSSVFCRITPPPSLPPPPLPDLLDSPCITSLGASPPPEVPQGARRAMRSPSRGPRRPKECVWGAREGSALVFAAAERINEESLLAEGEVRKGKEGRSSAWGGGALPPDNRKHSATLDRSNSVPAASDLEWGADASRV